MKLSTSNIIVAFLLFTFISSLEAQADLNWSWTFQPSTVEVSPDETISVYGFVSNDSTTEALTVGDVYLNVTEWVYHYQMLSSGVNVTVNPGESTSFLMCNLIPTGETPNGSEFTFKADMHIKGELDPHAIPKKPDQYFSFAVIPEPSTIALLGGGCVTLYIFRNRKKNRASIK